MRANDVLGIIQAQSDDSIAKELTAVRTLASIPFGCRYRLIDFSLSNMVNAGINQVGIITKDNYQSLMDHVGSGKPWELARKQGGMFILPPYNTSNASAGTRNSLVDSLYSIGDFLNRAKHEYVVIAHSNLVYNFDFNDLFRFHTEKDADVTVVYKHGNLPKNMDTMILDINNDGRVEDITISEEAAGGVDYSFGIVLIRKSLLMNLIQHAVSHNETSFKRDILQANVDSLKIYGYEASGFAEIIDSLKSYYKISMSLLDKENSKMLFDPEFPIATKVSDNVPATYGIDAKTSNSLVADGCQIEGEVENSLLFRGVVVEKGAVVKNSILMQGTVVHANASLNSVVTDKNVTISNSRNLSGDPTYPIYITKRITV